MFLLLAVNSSLRSSFNDIRTLSRVVYNILETNRNIWHLEFLAKTLLRLNKRVVSISLLTENFRSSVLKALEIGWIFILLLFKALHSLFLIHPCIHTFRHLAHMTVSYQARCWPDSLAGFQCLAQEYCNMWRRRGLNCQQCALICDAHFKWQTSQNITNIPEDPKDWWWCRRFLKIILYYLHVKMNMWL